MTDYDEIKSELQAKLKQLVSRVESIEADLSETPEDDWEERATELEDEEVLSSVGNVTLEEIQQIKQALHQIDNGTYGTCTRCGKDIPHGRLEALPYAVTCTQCA